MSYCPNCAHLEREIRAMRSLIRRGYRPYLCGHGKEIWYENKGDATEYQTADAAIDAAMAAETK